jgi:hypothetical protein
MKKQTESKNRDLGMDFYTTNVFNYIYFLLYIKIYFLKKKFYKE